MNKLYINRFEADIDEETRDNLTYDGPSEGESLMDIGDDMDFGFRAYWLNPRTLIYIELEPTDLNVEMYDAIGEAGIDIPHTTETIT